MQISSGTGRSATGTGSIYRVWTAHGRFFPHLEGMRGLASIVLVLTHLAVTNGEVGYGGRGGGGLSGAVLNRMEVGLPIFFLLSGVLLYRPFVSATLDGQRGPDVRRYLWRRVLRVVPAYVVLMVVATIVLHRDSVSGPWDVVRPLLFLGVAEPQGLPWGTEQTWSLSTEVAFYLVLPVVAGLLGWWARPAVDPGGRARRILIALLAVVVAGAGFTALAHRPAAAAEPVEYLWPTAWMGFLAVGMAIVTLEEARERGIEVFRLYSLATRRPAVTWALAGVAFAASCYLPIGTPLGAPNDSAEFPDAVGALARSATLMVVATLLVVPLTTSFPPSRVVRFVTTNPVSRFLGRISYGIFLWHVAVIHVLQGPGPEAYTGGDFGGALVVVLPVSIALATASYVLVERPFMRLRLRAPSV